MSGRSTSRIVYHSLKKELEEQGVIFLDMDSGLREHEDIVGIISGPSSRRTTTSLRRSTRPCGRAARSCTSRPA